MTVTTYAEKLPSKESSGHQKWELTSSIPLDDDGSSLEAALGKNPDVHYIYVCIKVSLSFFLITFNFLKALRDPLGQILC